MNKYKMSSKSVNDKFYTKRDTSNKIVKYCFSEFPELRDKEFFECSAGDGSFIDALKSNGVDNSNIFGIDIDPDRDDIVKADFLKDYFHLNNKVVISNPPFGKQNALVSKFTERAFQLNAEYVIWFAPFSFLKLIVRRLLDKGVIVKHIKILDESGFLLPDERIHSIRMKMAIFVLKQDVNYKLKTLFD